MNVLILAQGNQSRLPALTIPKQLLHLAACGQTILDRTLRQLARLGCEPGEIMIVGSAAIAEHLQPTTRTPAWEQGVDAELCETRVGPQVLTLATPGHSSLKGCAAALPFVPNHDHPTLILLGDVLYSWRCLELMVSLTGAGGGAFAGTFDLSQSLGEIFAVSYADAGPRRHTMDAAMAWALAHHPKFERYQPGQMRQWLFGVYEVDPKTSQSDWYTAVDDYTTDIDTPDDFARLAVSDFYAASDDRLRRSDGATSS